MAIAFVNSAGYTFAGTANTEIRATMPTGISTGHLLVVGFGNVGNQTAAATPASGWTVLREDTSGSNCYFILLAKIATSTEVSAAGTNIQVATAAGTGGQTNKTSVCLAYSGTASSVGSAVIAHNMKHESSPADQTIETNAATATASTQWWAAFANMADTGDQTSESWTESAGTERTEATINNATSTTSSVVGFDSAGTIAATSHEESGTWSGSATRLNGAIVIIAPPSGSTNAPAEVAAVTATANNPTATVPGLPDVTYIAGATASNSAGATTASLAPSVPAGTEGGDLIIACAYHNQNTLTPPAGWTQLGVTTDASSTIRGEVYYRVADAEPASYTWVISTAGIFGVGHFTFRNVDPSAIAATSNITTTDTTWAGPDVTLVGRGVVATFSGSRGSTTTEITYTAGSGDTERADWGNDGGSGTRNGHFQTSASLAAGTYGRSVSSVTGTKTDGVVFSIALPELIEGGGGGGEGGGTQEPEPPETTLGTYQIFVDWDNDGNLDAGNFEIDEDGWFVTGSSLPTAILSTARAHLGGTSMLITWVSGSGSVQGVKKTITGLVNGNSYTARAWVYVPSGDVAVRLTCNGVNSAASSVTNQWIELTVTFTANSTEEDLELEPSTTASAGDQVFLDQVSVLGDGEDISGDVLGVRGSIDLQYGRDTARSLSEFQPGETTFTVNNVSQEYSPDNEGSPLYPNVVPGRPIVMRVLYGEKSYTLFNGFLDDLKLNPDRNERSVEISALDVIQKLNDAAISTSLHQSITTGGAVHAILDSVGWPTDKRNIDQGATTIRWWWEEGAEAFEALNKVVASEGPPAIVYVDMHGNFVFRGRHHRVLDTKSTSVQATYLGGDEEITFVGAGTADSNTSAGTSYTLNRPANVLAGDLLIAFVVQDAISNISPPAGWTVVRSVTLDDGTDDIGLYVLKKDADWDDPSSWAGSLSISSSRRYARVLAYRGAAPADEQFINEVGSTSTGTSNVVTSASLSGGQPGNWRIGAFVIHDDSTAGTGWGSYSPTGTERVDAEVGAADPVMYISVADSGGHVAATGPRTMSATLSGVTTVDSSADWIGLIKPYSGEGLRFETEGFEYDVGWKDLINHVQLTVEDRDPTFLQTVFESEDTFVIASGDSEEIIVQSDEVFYSAITPEETTDYTLVSGAVDVSLSRDSGESVTVRITATSSAVVQGMKLRAIPVPVLREWQVEVKDSGSIARHGKKSLDDLEIPWCNRRDAQAVARAIIALRSERLPLITFSMMNSNSAKFQQQLVRDLSDRIHVVEYETFTNHAFYIERIEHAIEEVGHRHATTFGCERVRTQTSNVFTFGVAGKGFDQGQLGVTGVDDPDTVMILGEGAIDQKVLGT